jgi:tetratricopeptide (TPR) repeat protein
MKYGVLSVIAILFACMVYTQDMDPVLEEAAKLEKDLKEAEALDTYISVLKIQPSNVKALCRAAELSGRIGSRFKDDNRKTEYFTAAKSYAEAALKQKQDYANANYAMAYVAMKMATVTKGKERAACLRDMKNYADSALLFNPNHAGALYITGKWNTEIYDLNVAEKAAVKVLFGGMPKASLEAAILNFEKARAANPWMLVNYLDLANTYVQNHSTGKAIEVLNKMVKMPPRTGDDESLKAAGRKLLASLQ